MRDLPLSDALRMKCIFSDFCNLRPPWHARGFEKLISTNLTNLMSMEQFDYKPIGMYGGGLLDSANLRRPAKYSGGLKAYSYFLCTMCTTYMYIIHHSQRSAFIFQFVVGSLFLLFLSLIRFIFSYDYFQLKFLFNYF